MLEEFVQVDSSKNFDKTLNTLKRSLSCDDNINIIGNVILAHAEAVIQFKEDLTKSKRSKKEQELLDLFIQNGKTQFSEEQQRLIPSLHEKDLLKVLDLQTICDTTIEEDDILENLADTLIHECDPDLNKEMVKRYNMFLHVVKNLNLNEKEYEYASEDDDNTDEEDHGESQKEDEDFYNSDEYIEDY
uniref:Uncharacterized protein n=1 Tax=Panagrolaimus sp. ES5 TaxID=591445 RepID=A0AC34FPZ1_9BILA